MTSRFWQCICFRYRDIIYMLYVMSGKLAESVFSSQADILTRQLVTEDSSNESEANFQDLGYNADLYIFDQDDRQD